jgi:hypothetical protein
MIVQTVTTRRFVGLSVARPDVPGAVVRGSFLGMS